MGIQLWELNIVFKGGQMGQKSCVLKEGVPIKGGVRKVVGPPNIMCIGGQMGRMCRVLREGVWNE